MNNNNNNNSSNKVMRIIIQNKIKISRKNYGIFKIQITIQYKKFINSQLTKFYNFNLIKIKYNFYIIYLYIIKFILFLYIINEKVISIGQDGSLKVIDL